MGFGKAKTKNGSLMSDNSANEIITDSIEALREAGYADDYIAQFADNAVGVLNDYAELSGEGAEVKYCMLEEVEAAYKLGAIEKPSEADPGGLAPEPL